jgi:hypothetical protein
MYVVKLLYDKSILWYIRQILEIELVMYDIFPIDKKSSVGYIVTYGN